jgi:ribonuclease HI
VDEKIAEILEPGASAPGERLASLKLFKEAGIPTGVWFVPVIPFISDNSASMEKVIRAVKEVGAEFILIGGMTLKQGKQNEHLMGVLKSNFPELVERYKTLYSTETKWGEASGKYYEEVYKMAYALCKKYSLPTRIPYEWFRCTMDTKYEVAMILAHIGYFLEQEGTKRDAYKWAARNIQEVEDIVKMSKQGKLTQISAVGEKIAGMIEEIINTGRCGYYEKLRKGGDAPDRRLLTPDHRPPATDYRQLKLYTDGACKGNPGPGGWAAILISENGKQEFSGAEPATTNNCMELMAIIHGLKAIKQPSQVKIYSDSAYVVNAFQQHWIRKWRANGWRTADKQPVKNQELWQELIRLTQLHQVEWVKVKGHAGNKYNERCDQLAVSASTSIRVRGAASQMRHSRNS